MALIPLYTGNVPNRLDSPETFSSDTDYYHSWLPDAVEAMNSVATAMNLNETNSTSSTSLLIGTGSKSLTVETNKSFQAGMYIVLADTAAPSTNSMVAQITSYNVSTGAMVVNSLTTTGSGTKTAWTISQSAKPFELTTTIPITSGGTGATTASAALTALDGASLTSLAADTGASLIGFKQSGTGAVSRTLDSKNQEIVTDKDWGVVGDGVTDDTTLLTSLLAHCVENSKTLVLTSNAYKVSANILPSTTRTGVRYLKIHCAVPVTITYDSAAAGIPYFMYLATTAENYVFITGASFTFDGSSKCATFLRCDNSGADNTGIVDIQSKLILKNLTNTDGSSTIENGGVVLVGAYKTIVFNEPEVDTVTRTNAAAGACFGLSASGFTGTVDIYSPKISRVLTPSAADADGIKVIGKLIGAAGTKRQGKVTIHGGIYTDNEGRQIKSQCSDTTITNPTSIRQNIVSITQSVDFDFQSGNGLLISPKFIYKKNGATSPLSASHSPVAFQQLLEDEQMVATCSNPEMVTEVGMVRFCTVIHAASTKESLTRVSGLRVLPYNGFATTAFTTAIMDTIVSTIEAKTDKTTLEVTDCKGPFSCYGIAYNSYGSTTLTSKLNIVFADNSNTLGGSIFRPFYASSGSVIRAVQTFLFKNNTGFRNLYLDFDFTVNQMRVGSAITVDLATCTVTGMPAWAASGYATFHCIDQYNSASDRGVWAIKGSATAANTMYWTQDGGTTWGQIK